MKKYGVFDIVGPIMIGPSSSHTAGAVRLGQIARIIAGSDVKSVLCLLHGSFGKTYKGHGTDRALAAGILGMDPSDFRLKDSLNIAKEKNIFIEFKEFFLSEDSHPNTVKFVITKEDLSIVEITGCSIGGGNIKIVEIDGEELEFTGKYPTILIKHIDLPGVISKVTGLLYEENVNIAFMKVYRDDKGKEAYMIFETDNDISSNIIEKMKKIDNIKTLKVINKLTEVS
ncbi:MAG: L-serine ammonia-lyase, iron-sulfur-dependent subunit beta [Clostridiaceae bacterium]